MAYRERGRTPEAQRADRASGAQHRATEKPPDRAAAHPILGLQQKVGNQALGRLLRAGVIQAKLRVGQPNDRYEQEADRVAERVLKNNTQSCQRGGDCSGYQEGPSDLVQLKAKKTAPASGRSVPGNLLNHLGPSRPLNAPTRALFERRMGHDFSQVRVHTGEKAAKASRALNAHAFTIGQHIVFGKGNFALGRAEGKKLLAHELTHVIQQDSALGPRVQRAEIDDDPQFCQNLQDVTSRLDAHVNAALSAASSIQDGLDRVEAVYQQLGAGSPFSAIEEWAENLPATHQNRVPIKGTRFRTTENPFLLITGSPSGRRTGSGFVNAWMKGERAIGTLLKVGDQCIGSDKLGHFFQQGRDYFHISVVLNKGDNYARGFGEWLEGIMPSDPEVAAWIREMDDQGWPGFDRLAYNFSFWQGVFGLSTTGVFSRADLAANEAGMEFYKRVYASPNVTFSAQAYINGQWNERVNPSCFGPAMARLLAVNDPEFRRNHLAEMQAAYRSYTERAANTRQGISLSGQDELRRTMRRLLAPYVRRYSC